MTKRPSKRAPSIVDNLFGGATETEGTPSFSSKAKKFLVDYYRPIAVLVAILILVGVSLFIFKRIQRQNMQIAVQKMNDAKTYEDLVNPDLVQLIQGTKLEYSWWVKKLEKLQMRNKTDPNDSGSGTAVLDLEGYIEEAIKFTDKYSRTAMTPAIYYNIATYYAYLAEFDKAKAYYEKVINHPNVQFHKELAEKELERLADYTTDKDLNKDFKNAMEAYAKERIATPTPSPSPPPSPSIIPSPGTMPLPSGAPVIASPEPTALPEKTPEPVDLNPTPTPTPPERPTPPLSNTPAKEGGDDKPAEKTPPAKEPPK